MSGRFAEWLNPSVGLCLAILLASRILLFLFVAWGLTHEPPVNGDQLWQAFPENVFLDGWARWDSGWYGSIASSGYVVPADIIDHRARNTAFFPAYPLLTRFVDYAVENVFLSGILVANLAFFGAMALLYQLVSLKSGELLAFKTTLICGLFPYGFFFNAMYSESVFLLFVVAALLAAERRQWLLAGLLAGCASAARPMGVLLAVPIGLMYLSHIQFDPRRLRVDVLYVGLSMWGLLAYMGYQWSVYGTPLEFVNVQQSDDWRVSPRLFPLNELSRQIYFLSLISLIYFSVRYRRDYWPYALWGLLMLAVSYWRMHGIGRYLLVIFPCFIAIAGALKPKWLVGAVLCLSFLQLLYFSYEFSHWCWVA